MKDVDFVNQCAWKIEMLKSERTHILRDCEDKLEEIDHEIWSLKEQIKKKKVTSTS